MTTSDQRPPKSRVREYLTSAALIACVSIVLLATMWPTPLDQGFEPSVQRFLEILHRTGVPEWFGYNKLEFSANILMFVPIGFLTAMLLPYRVWWLSVIVCTAMSIGIEATQGAILAARFATPMDVLSNSVGAVIGSIVAVAIRAVVYRRDQKVIAIALWEGSLHSR